MCEKKLFQALAKYVCVEIEKIIGECLCASEYMETRRGERPRSPVPLL